MAEPSVESQLSRRAAWVGLRTLRQRPKLVEQTADGEPVFEIRSIRLVLRGDATHFTRLVHCSKCGRDVPGSPVLSPADLDQPSHAVICKDCVRRATQHPPPPALRVREAPLVDAQPAVTGEPVAGEAAVLESSRLDAVETQLGAVLARLEALAEAQRSDAVGARDADASGLASLAEVSAEMAALSEATTARVSALEAGVRQGAGDLAARLQAQGETVAALSSTVTDVHTEVQRVDERHRELADEQGQLGKRLVAMAQWVDSHAASVDSWQARSNAGLIETIAEVRAEMAAHASAGSAGVSAVEDQVRQSVGGLARIIRGLAEETATVGATVAEIQSELQLAVDRNRLVAEAQDAFGGRLLEMEQRIDAWAESVERRVDEVADGLGQSAGSLRRELALVAESVRYMMQARDDLQVRLDARLDALAATAGADADRVQTLEQKVQASLRRMTRLVGAQGHRPAVPPAPSPTVGPHPTSLVDGLERQLEEAEARLAER